MLKHALSCLAVTSAILLSTSSESLAQFQVCNRSSLNSIDVAFGLHRGRNGWESEGWFTINRRQCATLVARALRERYYYLYGASGDTEWNGDDDTEGADFCVRPGAVFKLNDDSMKDDEDQVDCEKHGYETKKFFQVDTNDASNFTFNFED
jgi:uncharacterized membrane protein